MDQGSGKKITKNAYASHSLNILWVVFSSMQGSTQGYRKSIPVTMMSITQFIQGIDEQSVPDVKLTKSRDGTIGMATFSFDQPSIFDSSRELGDVYKYPLSIQEITEMPGRSAVVVGGPSQA